MLVSSRIGVLCLGSQNGNVKINFENKKVETVDL